MAWGKDWLLPVQGRLAKAYLQLTQKELDRYNLLAQEAMKFGHGQVYSMAEIHGKPTSKQAFSQLFSRKFPWANS